MTVRVIAWLVEGTWEATVDAAARAAAGQSADVVLLYVVDSEISEAVHGAFGGLLGRGQRERDPGKAIEATAHEAARELLRAAAGRLGRSAELVLRTGQVEREVVAACEGVDLLVCARDGDSTWLGPHSLGRHTRFVVDHAPCAVLLIWPDEAPALGSLPPPRGGGPHSRHR